MRIVGTLLLCCTLQAAESGVPGYVVSTAAGSDFVGDGGAAIDAALSQPEGIVRDAAGNVFVADADGHRIRRITPAGIIETIAGDGHPGFSGDGGSAKLARLNQPYGLALDRSGALYIADLGNARVRRISRDATITTVAGGGSIPAGKGDGSPATLLQLSTPRNVAVDATGNLYISDFEAHRVYRVDLSGTLTTAAGTGEPGTSGDGAAACDAQLSHPAGLAIDYAGTLYIADSDNRRIRRLVGRTLWAWGGVLDSPPTGLAVDSGGNLFIGNSSGGTVMRMSIMGGLSALSVTANEVWAGDSQLLLTNGSQVASFDLNNGVRTGIAGAGDYHFSGDGGPAKLARLHGPYALASGIAGEFFVADLLNHRVRGIDSAQRIETVAGDGTSGLLNEISGLAVDSSENLFIADRAAHQVWRLDATGRLSLVAGTGVPELKGDNGAAASASLNAPHGLAFDPNGNLLIADTGNGRIRKITPGGWISTVVAGLSEPRGLAFDGAGNLYVAETGAGRVQRYAPSGTLEIIATGLQAPRGITVARDGTAYVAESGAGRLVALGQGTTAIPIADGIGLKSPMDVLALPNGSLLVADFGNDLVRLLVPQAGSVTLAPPASVLHAATNLEGPVAPGEIVSVYGNGFAGGCSLLASGSEAWLLYVGQTQINAILPGDLQPGQTSTIQVVCGGAVAGETAVTVASASPGLFAEAGRAAALNQDGTINALTNPASRGSIVSLFGTGLGTGKSATAAIAGDRAAVLYAGPAPGLPGVFQVNARIPVTVPAGNLQVQVTSEGVTSPAGVTLAIR